MTEFLHLASSDHLSFLKNFISSSFPHPSLSDVKLCARNGSISVNRLVLALLHPELASCPRLTLETDIAVIFPDLELAELRERVEAVLRGEWGNLHTTTHNIPMEYQPPPVKCELELENIDVKKEEPEEEEFVEDDEESEEIRPKEKRKKKYTPTSRKEKYQTFTHLQKLEFVRMCRENGGNINGTARELGLPAASLRKWRHLESEMEAKVEAGEGTRKTLAVGPRPLRAFEERLLDWLKAQGSGANRRPTRKEVSRKALELYKEEVGERDDQRRFSAGATYVDKFLTKTNSKDLVTMWVSTPDLDHEKIFSCEECGQTFTANNNLKQHKLIHHSDEQPHVCPHCGSGFKLEGNLRIHIRKHTGDKPYSCNQCAYTCADPSNFKKHQKCHRVPLKLPSDLKNPSLASPSLFTV